MRKLSVVLTDRQDEYLLALAKRWRVSRSWALREVVHFHMLNASTQDASTPDSTTAHSDGGGDD